MAKDRATSDPLLLQNRIAEKNAEFDRLLSISAQSDDESEFLDRRIKQVYDEILQLRQMKTQAGAALVTQCNADIRQDENNTNIFESLDCDLSEYNDTLTARTVERISVNKAGDLAVCFFNESRASMI